MPIMSFRSDTALFKRSGSTGVESAYAAGCKEREMPESSIKVKKTLHKRLELIDLSKLLDLRAFFFAVMVALTLKSLWNGFYLKAFSSNFLD
jgi:hypothetical protein